MNTMVMMKTKGQKQAFGTMIPRRDSLNDIAHSPACHTGRNRFIMITYKEI